MTDPSAYAACAAYSLVHADRPGLIVALHGMTGSRDQAFGLVDGLHPPGFGVLAPDLRAHGETPLTGLPADFTPARLAADVVELVRSLDLESRRVCVLGISLGATVALELIRSGGLDIVGGIFARPAHDAAPAVHLAVNTRIAALLRDDPATALARLIASDEYRAVQAVSPSGAANLRDKAAKPGSAERSMRLDAGSLWTAFLPAERVDAAIPTLVIGMRDDPLHPVFVAENWHRRIRGSSLVIVPSRDQDPAAATEMTRAAIATYLGGLAGQLGPSA